MIDSGSTDETLDILRSYPQVEVIQHPFTDFATQCNFGLTQVNTLWVLSLDADYELSDSLVHELTSLAASDAIAGYRAQFVYRIHGRALRGTLYPPRVVLYRKDKARYHNQGHGHRVTVAGEVSSLAGVIYHDDRKSLARWLASQQRYAVEEARYLSETPAEMLTRSDRIRLMGWPAPIGVLFYTLLVKGCILDGWPGWCYALQRLAAETLIALEVVDRRLRETEKLCSTQPPDPTLNHRDRTEHVRINIVIGPFYPIPPVLGGAVEKVHLLLAGAYRDAGHEVTIISRRYKDFPHEDVVDGIRHIRIPSFDRSSSLAVNLVLDFLYAVRVALALPAADVTITNAFFLPLFLPHRRAGKIYVQIGRYPKWQTCLYFRADRLQAVSSAVGRAIARQSPWLTHKIVVIGYAIPDQYFSAHSGRKPAQVVLYVGRIAREKGIELLLQGFASLPGRLGSGALEGWILRVVGPHAVTQGGDGPQYLAELRMLANRLDVQCDFVGPVFDQGALIREYQGSAVFVYPSLAETGEALPVAPLEAMAAGCATIVSRLRCFDDYIEDGVTGLKFDHRGPDPAADLAVKLGRVVGDPAYLQKVADAGHNAASKYSVTAIAGRMLNDFRALLSESRQQ